MAEALFFAAAVGAALGLLYDFFRLLRLVLGCDFFLDFLFWILTSFAVFCYLLVFNNGAVRGIFLLFILTGFILYFFTIGYVTEGIEKKLAKKVKIQLKKVKKLLKSFKKVLQLPNKLYYNIIVKVKTLFNHNYEGEKDG
ncbi:MAG: spore cortex biosynthesis protein YabQ [Eubacterium sp.]